jgi:hypothetical protein
MLLFERGLHYSNPSNDSDVDRRRRMMGKSARTANPVQTTGFFGVKKGFRGEGVNVGNPLCN